MLFQSLAVVMLFAFLTLALIFWRPVIGLYIALSLALFFEALSDDPLMSPGRSLYIGLAGLTISPFELLCVLTLISWLTRGIASRNLAFRGGRLGWQMLLFATSLAFGMTRGALSGGNMYAGLWEARFLLALIICYILSANTIRTKRHVAILLTITLVAPSMFAVEGIYRHFALINTGRLQQPIDAAWGHESALFLGIVLLLILAKWILGTGSWQRQVGLILVPVVGFTLLVSQRRASYIAVVVAFLAFSVVFLIAHRKAFLRVSLPFLLLGSLYFPLFWNDSTFLGQPARAFRSLIQPDPRDAASNLYRDLEKINVRATIEDNPLLGVGFGHEFRLVVALPDISTWPLWRYEPHNNILWIWLKTGAFGFAIFWVLMGNALAHAAHLVRTLREPTLATFALMSLGVIVCSLTFCWVDTGFTLPRFTVFLGTIMGALSVLDELDDQIT